MDENNNISETEAESLLNQYVDEFILKRRSEEDLLKSNPREEKYVIYLRKSTEDEQRQGHSFKQQKDACLAYAKAHSLTIFEIRREKKSAKIADKRKVFREILDTINSGKSYNSILSWHPDRLSRNMKEAGEILDMLDNGKIHNLQFPSVTFQNDVGGKLMLSILFAMAKEFSDKLSIDTKRGLGGKVEEGYYVGKGKKGYIASKEKGFSINEDTFWLYQNAWKDLLKGVPQTQIRKNLEKKGVKVSDNVLSNFFKDPFYTGWHWHGNTRVDLRKVDKNFVPMVSPQEFLLAQKFSRLSQARWSKTNDDFKPFADLVYCYGCNNLMRPYVTKGKGGRYLSVICSNSNCKDKRRKNKLTPIGETIRGVQIEDLFISTIEESLKVNKALYKKCLDTYLKHSNEKIRDLEVDITNDKKALGRLNTEIEKTTQALIDNAGKKASEKLTQRYNEIDDDIKEIEKGLRESQNILSEYKTNSLTDFPDYETFLNFFKNAVVAIKETEDVYVKDQLVKLVFLNIFVENKKVVRSVLQEPFNTLEELKILSGVDDGT